MHVLKHLKFQNIMINIVVEKQENKVYRKKLSVSRENKRSESSLLREDDL